MEKLANNPYLDEIHTFNEANLEDWDNFTKETEDGWLYHLSDYMKFAASVKTENYSICGLKDGKIVAIFPLFRYGGNILSTGYSGFIVNSKYNLKRRQKIVSILLDYIRKLGEKLKISALQVRLVNIAPYYQPPKRPNHNPLIHFKIASPLSTGVGNFGHPLTGLIDLRQTEEQILGNMDKDCRNQIRRAMRNNLRYEIKEHLDRDSVIQYHNLHMRTWQRTGLKPGSKQYYFKLADFLNKYQAGKFVFVYYQDKLASIVFLQSYKNGAIYWGNCSVKEFQKYYVNHFALWNAIVYCKEIGCEFFELGNLYLFLDETEKEFWVSKYKQQFTNLFYPSFEGQIILDTEKYLESALVQVPIGKLVKIFAKTVIGRFRNR